MIQTAQDINFSENPIIVSSKLYMRDCGACMWIVCMQYMVHSYATDHFYSVVAAGATVKSEVDGCECAFA